MQRSKLLLGSLVTVGVLGFGAAAVALDGGVGDTGPALDGTTTTTVVDSTTTSSTTTTIAPTTTTAPAPATLDDPAGATPDAATDGGVARSTDGCDGGTYANHGDYVSSVAHSTERAPGDVAAAAQSDCGKPLTSVGGDAADTPEVPETVTPESGPPPTPGNSGNGNGKGLGRTK